MTKTISNPFAYLLSASVLATTLSGATLRGRVYDAATSDHRGIPGAKIDVTFTNGARSATTGADGTYAVDDLPNNAKVTATYIADGYQVHPTIIEVDLSTATTKDIPMAREVDNVAYFETLAGTIYNAQQHSSSDTSLLAEISMRLPPESRQVVDRTLMTLQERASLQTDLAKFAATRSDPRGLIVTLPGVSFDTGKVGLKPDARGTLAKIAEELKANQGLKITVAGHTDNVGAASINRQLSNLRADSVRAYLVDAGVPADSITAVGLSESEPVATNKTAAGRSLNRRVELIIQWP
jgi:outer membrane protein OmpA-like peptidoglycan-associated protein